MWHRINPAITVVRGWVSIERLAIGSLVGALALFAAGIVFLHGMYKAEKDEARSDGMTVVNILGEHFRRTFGEAGATLRGVAAILSSEEAQLGDQDRDHMRMWLFSGANASSVVTDFRVVDALGVLQFASEATKSSVADQLAVIAHANRSTTEMLVSEPTDNGRGLYELIASVPYFVKGNFAGVVTGHIPITEVERLFEGVQLAPGQILGLTYKTERIVYRSLDGTRKTGTRIDGTPIGQEMARTASGHVELTGTIDGVKRVYTFSKVLGLPLYVYMAQDVATLMDWFFHKTRWVAVVIALFAAFQGVVSLSLLHAGRAKSALESELRALATTDALTGVANRRRFNEALAAEWKRAARARSSVGLLMIDADFFKRYNDHYGHGAGDALLQKIAVEVRKSAQRPADLGARVGGEEFAVILPGLDLEGAMTVGDALRQRIESSAFEHAEHPLGIATVSIGASAMVPHPSQINPDDLVMSADAALYEAKAKGRNRVEHCPLLRFPPQKRVAA